MFITQRRVIYKSTEGKPFQRQKKAMKGGVKWVFVTMPDGGNG